MVFKLRMVALVLVAVLVLFGAHAPDVLLRIFHNLLALWAFGLLVLALGALVWFVGWFFLRRILRARRIANARMNRLMRESVEKERE
jgi:membrane protein implicated in regulation of membrane protease activity